MNKKMFDKWIKILRKQNNNIRKELKENKITKNVYILLNTIILDRYNQIITKYHKELK